MHPDSYTDRYTVAAAGLTAMCIVTFDHEALGHGGMCQAIGGQIEVLTSSIFRCTVRSVWIDPAGPAANLLAGTLSLLMAHRISRRLMVIRLLLTLVAAFSFFWESAYLIKAMLGRNGDLYFAAEDFLGEPSLWWRITGTGAGVILYVMTARWVSRELAQHTARIAWIAASLGAAFAAIANVGHGWAGFKDAVLEIAAASVPLLFIAGLNDVSAVAAGATPISRNRIMIGVSLAIYAVFVATLGRGLYS